MWISIQTWKGNDRWCLRVSCPLKVGCMRELQPKQGHWRLNIDGNNIGKPGPSGVGFTIEDDKVGLLIAFSDLADIGEFNFELKFRQSEKGMVVLVSLLGSLPIVAACRNTIRRGSRISSTSSTPCRLPNFLKEIKLLPSFLENELYKQTHWQNRVFFFKI